MTIYAIFLCVLSINRCRPIEAGHYSLGTWVPGTVYQSLNACDAAIRHVYARGIKPDSAGHYVFASGMWYECLSRHVDTWNQP